MESVSGSDVRLRRVGDVELGHRARQEFARGRSRRCDGVGAFIVPALHRIDMALRHLGCHMGIIVKFGEALPCVKSPVSRTSGAIYVVM